MEYKIVDKKIMKVTIILLMITAMIMSCGGLTDDTSTSQSMRLYNVVPIEIYTWGKNENGQLGNGTSGTNAKSTTPVAVEVRSERVVNADSSISEIMEMVSQGKTWKQISAGYGHTMVIDSAGMLYAWGDNRNGQLGIGTETVEDKEVLVSKDKPVKVGTKTWEQVSAGGGLAFEGMEYTVAIDSAGKLHAWGDNRNGQLGIGTETVNGNEELVAKNTPTELVMDPAKTWKQVSAGGNHIMAIDSDDYLFAWGSNANGQLGNGNTDNQNVPVQVVIATDRTKTWTQVSTGSSHTVAIDSAGALYTWGLNQFGQLGNGESGKDVKSTSPVKIGTETWKQVSAGDDHTMAIDSNDHLFAWGAGGNGQLGDSKIKDQATPVTVQEGLNIPKTWKQVSAGAIHTIAIDSGGALYTWGSNANGQLGNGQSLSSVANVPRPIEGTKQWTFIDAGGNFTAALTEK